MNYTINLERTPHTNRNKSILYISDQPTRFGLTNPLDSFILLMMIKFNAIALLALFMLSACHRKASLDYLKESPDFLFQRAQTKLARGSGSVKEVTEILEKVIQIYPYAEVTPEAQFLLIIAHQKNGKHASAVANAETFLQIYPSHPKAPDAMYLRACSYYAQTTGARDIEPALMALVGFKSLQKKHPNLHTQACTRQISHLNDILASSLMLQARKLYKRVAVVAAISRYREVVEKYPLSTFVDEAYFRLIECSLSLGLVSEAQFCLSKISNIKWIKAGMEVIAKHNKTLRPLPN